MIPAFTPRDRKLVSNTIYTECQGRLLSNDDIVGVYLIYKELPHFVQSIILVKEFSLILFSEEMAEQLNNLAKHDECFLSYDTTFNLGDFYVSPLSYRHPLFKSEPVILLAYLVHDNKNNNVHSSFFNFLSKSIPNLNGLPIVTDREIAINTAIKTELPKSKNFYCWNHLLIDVRHWIKKQKVKEPDDENIYSQHTWDMLDSNSFEDFSNKYDEQMSEGWSAEFKNYFDKNIYTAIADSGKWVLQKVNI